MPDISYGTVMAVTMSWDKLKAVPSYQDKAGELIFCRLFELEPKARNMFGYSATEEIKANPKFLIHAHSMVDMIDCAVGFLGPDLDPLVDDMQDLGKRHISYGVESEYLPVMERAVMYAMEEILDNQFTRDDRQAWQLIFHFMITNMVKGMKSA